MSTESHLPDARFPAPVVPRGYDVLIGAAERITDAGRELRHVGYTDLGLQVYDIVNAIHEEIRRARREQAGTPHLSAVRSP